MEQFVSSVHWSLRLFALLKRTKHLTPEGSTYTVQPKVTRIFHWTTFRFDYGIFSTSLCNVTKYFSVQSCIHFSSVNSCEQPPPAYPEGFQWDKDPDSVVVKLMSHALRTTLLQFEPDESGHRRVCPCYQVRKKQNNLQMGKPGYSVYSGRWL